MPRLEHKLSDEKISECQSSYLLRNERQVANSVSTEEVFKKIEALEKFANKTPLVKEVLDIYYTALKKKPALDLYNASTQKNDSNIANAQSCVKLHCLIQRL